MNNGERYKLLYSHEYFKMYGNDLQREQCYQMERDYIVKLKPEGGTILDIGCGLGLFLSHFDNGKWKKFGVDVSDHAIQEARKRGITVKDYAEAYNYSENNFDVIVFRGSVQHLDTPFAVIKKCIAMLKPGGLMAFLATPNANSIYYKLFNTLPCLHAEHNFYIPSDVTLSNILVNFGMKIKEIKYPYIGTPYAKLFKDHLYFILHCLGFSVKFPFWRNMMEIYAIKPE